MDEEMNRGKADQPDFLYSTFGTAWGLERLPEHMRMSMFRYLAFGISGGGFMTAMLSGDYYVASCRADGINLKHFVDWIRWLHECCPHEARGSREAVNDWCRSGGLRGISSGTLIAR